MRRLVALVLMGAATLAGCGEGAPWWGGAGVTDPDALPSLEAPADDPWPAAYHENVCLAVSEASNVSDTLFALSDAAAAFDVAVVADQSWHLESEAETMRIAISRAPAWPPGSEVVRQIAASAKNLHRAAELIMEDVDELSEPMILGPRHHSTFSMPSELMEKGGKQATAAAAEIIKLGSQYGFYCP